MLFLDSFRGKQGISWWITCGCLPFGIQYPIATARRCIIISCHSVFCVEEVEHMPKWTIFVKHNVWSNGCKIADDLVNYTDSKRSSCLNMVVQLSHIDHYQPWWTTSDLYYSPFLSLLWSKYQPRHDPGLRSPHSAGPWLPGLPETQPHLAAKASWWLTGKWLVCLWGCYWFIICHFI